MDILSNIHETIQDELAVLKVQASRAKTFDTKRFYDTMVTGIESLLFNRLPRLDVVPDTKLKIYVLEIDCPNEDSHTGFTIVAHSYVEARTWAKVYALQEGDPLEEAEGWDICSAEEIGDYTGRRTEPHYLTVAYFKT